MLLVITLTEVDTIDEAVELANATEYSLGAGLWTTNVHHAMDVSMRMRAGTLSLNALSETVSLIHDYTRLRDREWTYRTPGGCQRPYGARVSFVARLRIAVPTVLTGPNVKWSIRLRPLQRPRIH